MQKCLYEKIFRTFVFILFIPLVENVKVIMVFYSFVSFKEVAYCGASNLVIVALPIKDHAGIKGVVANYCWETGGIYLAGFIGLGTIDVNSL
jgi:hypothetical protein